MTRTTDRTRKAKLTKRTVDGTKPASARFVVWDTDLPGFGLRVEPTGRKTFIARYRAGGGRSGALRQATIGRYGPLTADEARGQARRLLGKAAGGGDPVGDKKRAQQTGVTVGEVMDWYLREASAGRLLGRRGRPIKTSTIAMDRSRIETHVKPLIGRRPVSGLTPAELEGMQADIATGKSALRPAKSNERRKRGGIPAGGGGVAARTLGMVLTILEHARRATVIADNPARGARKMAGARRQRRLNFDEIRALGEAMRISVESRVATAAIRFTLLSGFRRNEALSIRAGDIVPAGGVHLPDSKSGSQVRPIGQDAMAVLKRQIALHGNDPMTWIFPAERGSGHFVGLPKVLTRLCKAANLKGVSVHTLRHTFASVAGELGFSELVIAALLGHSAGSVTSGYVHLDRALVAAAERVAEAIARLLDGDETAEILTFHENANRLVR